MGALTGNRRVVRLIHAASGREIARSVEIARTAPQRMRGLLGREALPPGEGMMIERCSSIHTCFMKFPLDVIFLDSQLVVKKVIRNLRPWRLASALGASHVIELGAGALEALAVEPGDALKIEDVP
jgi:hypothetical protein